MPSQSLGVRAFGPKLCVCVPNITTMQVRTMQEHWDLMRTLLSRDVAYQAPIIATYDRYGARQGQWTHVVARKLGEISR